MARPSTLLRSAAAVILVAANSPAQEPGAAFASPETGPQTPVATPVAAPVAVPMVAPVAAPVDEFATVDDSAAMGGSASGEAPAPNLVDISDFTNPAESQRIAMPKGTTISETKSGARIIEVDQPDRVAVYPDDPESAWWEINPHHAFDRAQREQKPLMLLFTATWNPQSMSLSQEVFATKSFNEYVKENLVICYLTYPRNITDAPGALRHIKEKFKVRGYPNVLIFNPTGEVERGIRGYRSGRPVDYFNQLVGACGPVLDSIRARREELVSHGFRDWSNYLGKLLFARFIERDSSQVVLQDASGQKWSVPKNDLAPDDQRLVESFPAVDKLEIP